MPSLLIAEYEDAPKGCMYGNDPNIDKSGLKDLHYLVVTESEIQEVKECTLERLESVLTNLIEKYTR